MKESFLLYKSFYEPIKGLSLEEKGILLDAIFQYQIDGTEPTNKSIIMPFMFFKNQFRLDGIKYNKIVDRNRINGSKGGRPKKPSGLIDNPKNPSKPKKADKDNVNEKDNDKVKYIAPDLFYQSELKNANGHHKEYNDFINILFGENHIETELKGVLSIKNQVTAKQFDKIWSLKVQHKKSIAEILLKIENDPKYWKGKTNLYMTLLNWIKKDF